MVTAKNEFGLGDRVKHPKFGEGDVIDVYPMREDTVVVVSFEKIGQKKMVLKHAKLSLVPKKKEESQEEEK